MTKQDPVPSPENSTIPFDAGAKEAFAELCTIRDKSRKKVFIAAAIIYAVPVLLAFFIDWDYLAIILPAYFLVKTVSGWISSDVDCPYKKLVIPALLKEIDPGLSYDPDGYIPEEDFLRPKINVVLMDYYGGEDMIQGSYKGIQVRFSEVMVARKYSTGDNTRQEMTYDGIFMIADFNKEFKHCHWVLPDTSKARFGKAVGGFIQERQHSGYGHMIRMEDSAFEKKFAVYTEDEEEARRILTPELMRSMMESSKILYRKKPQMGFAFMDSSVYVSIPIERGRSFFRMQSHGEMGEVIRKTKWELKTFLNVFDALELNSHLWYKDAPEAVPESSPTP